MGVYFRNFSEFIERIDMDALADQQFRSELLSNDNDTIKTALKNKYGITADNLPDDIKIQVHEDSASLVNIVLSPATQVDGNW